MQNINNIEIPMTKELEKFLIYLNTQKKAYEINRSLQQVKLGKTDDIGKLFDDL